MILIPIILILLSIITFAWLVERDKDVKQPPIKTRKNHHEPNYYGYKSGFNNITVCIECGSTALYEDQHPARPCRNCGSKVVEDIGRWVEKDGVYYWELKKLN